MAQNPKIGLALGSGGARGLAHIGVIKALEEAKIKIDYIAGSSIGAWIGAWYARYLDIKLVEEFALAVDWKQIADLLFDFDFGDGLVSGEKMEKLIRKQLGDLKFSDLKIPLSVVACDLKNGEKVVIKTGDAVKAIRASMSVPIIFKPTLLDGRVLVDGGLVEPVPVLTAHQMGANAVIAVNLDAHHLNLNGKEKLDNLFSISQRIVDLTRVNLARRDSEKADVVVSPSVNFKSIIGWREFFNAKKIIQSGFEAARAELGRIKKLLNK